MSAKKKTAKRLPRKTVDAFDSALEPPASKQIVPVATVEVRLPVEQAQILAEEIGNHISKNMEILNQLQPMMDDDGAKQFIEDSIMAGHIPRAVVSEQGVVVSSEDFDDEYEEYAPSPDNVPLAAGETQETAIKPGGWHSYGYPDTPGDAPPAPKPEPEEAVTAETAFAAPPEPPEARQTEAVALDPTFTYETLSQLVDAVEFLAKRVKNLQPKDRTILTLRIERARKLQRSLPK